MYNVFWSELSGNTETTSDAIHTISDLLESKDLTWKVEQSPVYTICPQTQLELKLPYKANIKPGGRFLGLVSNHYTVVQNTECFSFLDTLVDENLIVPVTAFSLQEGRKVVVVCKMRTEHVNPGDKLNSYLFCTSSHDGSTPLRTDLVVVREVCANGMRLPEQTSTLDVVRHIGDVEKRIKLMRSTIYKYISKCEHFTETARKMAEKKLAVTQMQDVLMQLLPPTKNERTNRHLENVRSSILSLVYNSTNTLPNMEESAWALFGAVIEYFNHHRKYNSDHQRKYNSLMYGTTHQIQTRCYNLLCDLYVSS